MAKISLSGLIRTRLKFRILTFIAVLLLFGIFAEMIVVKNPKQSKAATVYTFDNSNANRAIGIGDFITDPPSYDEVIIDNVEVSMLTSDIFGSHRFKKLTIKGASAKLTHPGLVRTDYDSNKNMQNSGLVKRIDIVADEINMFNGGSIDVSGKGERGGYADKSSDCVAQWGYPSIEWSSAPPTGDFYTDATLPSPFNRGGGEGAIAGEDAIRLAGAGGGGHGGKGGYGYIGNYNSAQFDLVRGGSKNDSEQEPSLWGSGGGGGCSKKGLDVAVDGANGGGRVRIRANTIRFDSSTSGIYAQGSNVNINSSNRDATGGAGAGGSIWLADKDGNNNINSKLVIEAKNRGAGLNGSPNVDSGYNLDRALVPVAEAGTAYFGGSNSSGLNLYGSYFHANGGDAIRNNGSEGGGGGGGRIAIYGIFRESCYITQADPDYIPSYCENRDVVIDGTRSSGSVVPVNSDHDENGSRTVNNGRRDFASINIQNNGVLTHTTINDGEYDDRPSGIWKRVELQVSGDVVLISGGKIDVNEKGYLGYPFYGGPGGGYNPGPETGGGGGSYGGRGGWNVPGDSAPTYGDREITGLRVGSGGGGKPGTIAARAGGRVKLTANRIIINVNSSITANAHEFSGDENRSNDWWAGGASGGSVYMAANEFSSPLLPSAVAGSDSGGGGEHGTITYSGIISTQDHSFSSPNIMANGSAGHWAGNGGGGRIYFKKLSSGVSGISVKKTLEPVDRNGSALFNPYALLTNDRIRVRLLVTNMNQAITLEDEFLSNRDGNLCAYIAGSASPATGVTSDASSITWTGLPPGSDSSAEAYYLCRVQ